MYATTTVMIEHDAFLYPLTMLSA